MTTGRVACSPGQHMAGTVAVQTGAQGNGHAHLPHPPRRAPRSAGTSVTQSCGQPAQQARGQQLGRRTGEIAAAAAAAVRLPRQSTCRSHAGLLFQGRGRHGRAAGQAATTHLALEIKVRQSALRRGALHLPARRGEKARVQGMRAAQRGGERQKRCSETSGKAAATAMAPA